MTESVVAPKNEFDTSLLNDKKKDASSTTTSINNLVYSFLDFDDTSEEENATRGLISSPDELELVTDSGKVIWSQKAYEFLDTSDSAPDSAHPSLWRNAKNNHDHGLFKVVDGIYQVRGYDMSNITFVASDNGWIVFDPLMSVECAHAALELVNKELGKRPIKAIIMSHSHVDHFGGIKGIISEEEVEKNNIPLIVPEGFVEHVVSKNVYAGNAMSRRASYQYALFLDPGPEGSLSIGIGMGQSNGTISYIQPNDVITQTGETREIDGVTMEFQMTPGTEAPAEMNTWFAQKKALWVAENCTCTLHNLYTLRGAEVRDGNAWANYLMETVARYGSQAEVTFQAHNWPHWGNDVIRAYLENTAAMYKFITDQTLMYLNKGYTSSEIANMLQLPKRLESNWYTRQYYGTIATNSAAVYQKYMGFYVHIEGDQDILDSLTEHITSFDYFFNIIEP